MHVQQSGDGTCSIAEIDRTAGITFPTRLLSSGVHVGLGPRLLMIFVLYFLAAAWAVSAYRYQINPDAISYISIAQKYLAGDFGAAINAYWSPLYSWLLMPFLAIGIPALLATKVLTVFLGFGSLIAAWKL